MGSAPPRPRRARRSLLAAAVAVAAAAVTGALAAPVAHAENSLVSSSPADGASLAASPTSMVFTFAEPLGPTNTAVTTCNGAPFATGNPATSADGLSLTVAVPNPMPKGTCNVVVLVSSPDSSPNGQFPISFTITADAPAVDTAAATTVAGDTTATVDPAAATTVPAGTSTPTTEADDEASSSDVGGPLGLSRLIAALALAVLLGSFVLIVTAWPEGVEYILTVRFLRTAWIVAVAASVFTVVFMTVEESGRSVGSAFSPSAWFDLADSTPGLAALARLAFAAGCGWVVMRPERCIDQASQLPALAIPVLAVATYGFSRTGGDLAPVGVLVGIVHALAMAVWLGGVVLLSRVVLAGPGEDDLVHAVRGFSRISTPALLLTVVTGVVQMWRLDKDAIFDTSHGRVVLLKAVAVAVMVFVGVATRQFVRTRLRSVDSMSAPLASRLRRATGIEAVGGVAVLGLTAWLLSMTPPGLVASADVSGDYGYTQGRVVADDLDLTIMLTGVVGRNGVRIEVAQPASGLSDLVITFTAPAGTQAASVVLTVPAEVTGTGAAVLDESVGIPLDAPGVWTIDVTATTPTGTKSARKTFNLLS